MYIYIKPQGAHVMIQYENTAADHLKEMLQNQLNCAVDEMDTDDAVMTIGSEGFSPQSVSSLGRMEITPPAGMSAKQLAKAIHQQLGYTFIDKGDYFLITDNPQEP